jgi:NAD(P)H dehydrogenase (quinone)
MLCLTSGGTRERFSANGVYGEMHQVLWSVQRLVIEYLGMQALDPFVAYAAPRVDQATREHYLQAWRTRILEIAGAEEVAAE